MCGFDTSVCVCGVCVCVCVCVAGVCCRGVLMKEIESEEQHIVRLCVILTYVCVCVLQECVDEGDRE